MADYSDDTVPTAALSRRHFLQSAAGAAGVVSLPVIAGAAAIGAGASETSLPVTVGIALRVNGQLHELSVEPRLTLLDAMREHLNLPGTKKGCDRGQCGACTVLVNGRRINSCLALAIMHVNEDIVTVEGLAASGGSLHPVQAAFLEHDAFQCGYCTPGQICSAVGLIEEHRREASAREQEARLTDEDIRERMSGNICRCGAYVNIVAAVRAALDRA